MSASDFPESAFEKYTETAGYVPDFSDLVFEYDNYCFVVQTKEDFNNILLVGISKVHKDNLRNAFLKFREFLIEHKIQYVRIESYLDRYAHLMRMIPGVNVVTTVLNKRSVLYAKVY